ncbi:hypothetical protein BST63_20085 [Bradyrhizobium canariense]|uniref:Uncharacterized protein n=1 Tax=Bradyrhizobium canariense TaxID=255045 RepID=A0A1X3GHS7_9BRAD|nr:hypothetical protein BSZ24_21650 [Bradyrhizobium canariense]OSI90843.1 hypothetical protein BSZ25_16795 [Bradyrhizobium canariense]OSJ01155.1 hypothetical protein BSZ16_21200 [Bradyrhizobium canariense]OSJ01565.1 hypothetical protein BSZ18_37685 [Bradyrhizobium canariense]OSJ27089.1 hypothetical protein BST63_20085 [Bradyrhizobium canariense]
MEVSARAAGKHVGLRLVYDRAVGRPFDLSQGPAKSRRPESQQQLDTFGRDDPRDTTGPGY